MLRPGFKPNIAMMQDPRDHEDRRLRIEFYYDAKATHTGEFIRVPMVRVESPEKDVHVEEIKGLVGNSSDRANYWFERFPKRFWAAFMDGEKPAEGAPLDVLGLQVTVKKNLEFHNVLTVDQLAECTDSDLANFGPGYHDIREKARLYLEALKGTAPVMELQTKLQQSEARSAELEDTLKTVLDRVSELEKSNSKKSSSKKKTEEQKAA